MARTTLKTVGVPKGVKWNATITGATSPRETTRARAGGRTQRPATLAEMNKRLADSREARLRAAEANCVKLTGKPRL